MVLTFWPTVSDNHANAHDLAIGQVLGDYLAMYGGGGCVVRTANKFVFRVVLFENGVLASDTEFHLEFSI
jgi:hypothetical protein